MDESLAVIGEQVMEAVMATTVGYRAKAIANGLSESLADDMACDYHHAMMELMTTHWVGGARREYPDVWGAGRAGS